jgi:AAA+ ATPase superfamily predicted ATPase
LNDLRDTAQAASILSLIGQGCYRLSEIAARLEKPATSLSRPLQRLIALDLVPREVPFGASGRNNKKTLYKIADPFLRFWFRFVEPNRSRLDARQIDAVAKAVERLLPRHTSQTWEELARASVPTLRCFDLDWRAACRWWGPSLEKTTIEIDIVAESMDCRSLLIGEAKWGSAVDAAAVLARLERKAALFPLAEGKKVYLGVWAQGPSKATRSAHTFTPRQVLRALR